MNTKSCKQALPFVAIFALVACGGGKPAEPETPEGADEEMVEEPMDEMEESVEETEEAVEEAEEELEEGDDQDGAEGEDEAEGDD
jgi:hypothetical protein